MASTIQNPVLIDFVIKQNPSIFHEPSNREERVEQTKRLFEEAKKVLEDFE
jgi:hypothetical protein